MYEKKKIWYESAVPIQGYQYPDKVYSASFNTLACSKKFSKVFYITSIGPEI